VQTDPHLSDRTRSLLTKFQTRSIVLFPLITSNQWYGMLTVHFGSPKILRPEDLGYFEKVVNQAAAAIYNFLLLEAETKAVEKRKRQMNSGQVPCRNLARAAYPTDFNQGFRHNPAGG